MQMAFYAKWEQIWNKYILCEHEKQNYAAYNAKTMSKMSTEKSMVF